MFFPRKVFCNVLFLCIATRLKVFTFQKNIMSKMIYIISFFGIKIAVNIPIKGNVDV